MYENAAYVAGSFVADRSNEWQTLSFTVIRKYLQQLTINADKQGARRMLYKKSPFRYNRCVQATIIGRKGEFMAKQANSLEHTKWMCKYHIVFTPKYRRKIVYTQYKADLRDILKQLCSYKGGNPGRESYAGPRTHAGKHTPDTKYFGGILTSI